MWCFSKIFALKKGVFRAFWILLALYNCLQIAPDSSLYVLIFKSYKEESGAICRQLYRATMFPGRSFFWVPSNFRTLKTCLSFRFSPLFSKPLAILNQCPKKQSLFRALLSSIISNKWVFWGAENVVFLKDFRTKKGRL